jgi:hypothetical protein
MEQRVDRTYRARGWKIRAPIWILGLLAFSGAVYRVCARGDWSPSSIGPFIVLAVIGLIVEGWLKRSYRCPRCSTPLGDARIQESNGNSEYVYDCHTCQITWRTLTYVPEGDA